MVNGKGEQPASKLEMFWVLWVAAPAGVYFFLISASKLRCLEPKALYYASLELVPKLGTGLELCANLTL